MKSSIKWWLNPHQIPWNPDPPSGHLTALSGQRRFEARQRLRVTVLAASWEMRSHDDLI